MTGIQLQFYYAKYEVDDVIFCLQPISKLELIAATDLYLVYFLYYLFWLL